MAWQLPFTAPVSPTPFPLAYVVISGLEAQIPSNKMVVYFSVYTDQASYQAGCDSLTAFSRTITIDDPTAIMAAIQSVILKAPIPELVGAQVVA